MTALGYDSGLSIFSNSILLPVLLSISLTYFIAYKPTRTTTDIKTILLGFLILNSGLAIAERVLHTNFFPFTLALQDETVSIEYESIAEFRSTALMGHPLSNALCTTVIMSFILISELPEKKKYALWLLGYVAILCFNARSSILAWGGFAGIYIMNRLWDRQYSVSKKIWLIALGAIGLLAILYLIFNTGIGGRLLSMELFDNSGTSRLRIFEIFDYYSFGSFLFGGVSPETMYIMANTVGLGHIENYWLIYIFRFGIIYTVILTILFYNLFKRYLTPYNKFQKIFVVLCFLLISSTNNSLAMGVPAISVFLLCAVAFGDSNMEYSGEIYEPTPYPLQN